MTALPALGAQPPQRGSPALRWLGRAVLRAMRFRVEGSVPDVPKMVMAVAPHTSNWDFVVGAAVMFALDLRLSFIAKHTLFFWPFSVLLRWMGGIPVDRASAHGIVGDSVRAFDACGSRILVITPEGTRKRVERFKTGFLHIAHEARVPILLVAFDWAARVVRLGPVFTTTGDIEGDRVQVEAHYAGVRGRNR